MSVFPSGHPLHGAALKVLRAQDHLDAVRLKVEPFAEGNSEVGIKHEYDSDTGRSMVHLAVADPGADLSVVVGDCLFCLRSSLDHIVQALLMRPAANPKRVQFPICSKPENFVSEIASRGLKDCLSDIARTTIEGLQPYNRPQHPLAMLRDLHNIDKHKTLLLTPATPDIVDLAWSEGGEEVLRYRLIGSDLTDGTELLHGLIAHGLSGKNVQVSGKAASLVVFQDEPCAGLPVVSVLETMLDYFNGTIFPTFKPFFC